MALALRTAGPAIFASGLTVIAALLCLTLAEVNGTSGLGPIGALGIAVAMVAMLTLLPALLVIVGRWVFFPFIPRFDPAASSAADGRVAPARRRHRGAAAQGLGRRRRAAARAVARHR